MSESSHPPQRSDARVSRIERTIGHLLRWGVVASLLLLIAGTALNAAQGQYGHTAADTQRLTAASGAFPAHDLPWLFNGLRERDGQPLIVLGLLLLIATPVARVIVSIVAFALSRDWPFVLITAIVLALLGVSFAIGEASP